ncbi:MAG: TetR/AcrR family transcriptional regulator [Thermoguttaceae bacterium]|nr:TetR/AcrR family transcriptional regulator [Thermoguttaceae bacterium]MBQ2556144.1 TetR/AcrR family transcriptional regulator [Thermoguttaceae bacterium]MBQ4080440.1 TetR/AcrR family transcriptional regulator [Thermoguttaceae bacterium]MBQ4203237.1 TetR/AcrR family transcriptional regulator [Thermoguttaceae bacterium]MBQ5366093.1 TetR/AcrR family transcriptional regulator [Thermoguttaceae bacterium]
MTVLVDHQERRKMILERAFELFAEEGFSGVTYQKIADRCGISRTSIYKYFKDKDQIFIFAIKLSTDKLSSIVEKVVARHELTPVDKIRRVLHLTIKLLTDNQVFLSVLLEYLTSLKSSGGDVRHKARARTIGMRVLLTRLVRDAIQQKFFRKGDPELIASRLFCIIEAYVLNLTVTDMMDRRECLSLIDSSIDGCLLDAGRA